MDRARFEHLLEAYGGDFRNWPADERAAAAAFKLQHGQGLAGEIAAARALDAALDAAWGADAASDALAARILATRPRANGAGFDGRAFWALAACAVFGVLLGYCGGVLVPASSDDADIYIAMAFESPLAEFGEEG